MGKPPGAGPVVIPAQRFGPPPAEETGTVTAAPRRPEQGGPHLAHISHRRLVGVAHALLRAVSRLFPTRVWSSDTASKQGVGRSADAARKSACATRSPSIACEKCGLAQRNSRATGAVPGRNTFSITKVGPAPQNTFKALAIKGLEHHNRTALRARLAKNEKAHVRVM
jgi:hypothetical protein